MAQLPFKQIEDTLTNEAHKIGCEINCFQSNHEGFLIDKIHEWTDKKYNGLIINPGGFTHTSVAIRDAISTQTNLMLVLKLLKFTFQGTFMLEKNFVQEFFNFRNC